MFEALKHTPIWVGPSLAATVFLLLYFVVPFLIPAGKDGFSVGLIVKSFSPMFGWLLALMIMMAWVGAELHKFLNRRLLDKQTSADSVRDLSWREFEHLIGEYYRRLGYRSEVVGGVGDGGVDIVLSGHNGHVLVQCKQWKTWTVGVQPVRELLGVVTSESASRGILVTSGRFTREARRFAEQNDVLELVDGDRLEEMIRSVQAANAPDEQRASRPEPTAGTASVLPACPTCNATMVQRTARRGPNAGSRFWGCPSYPRCRGIRPLN